MLRCQPVVHCQDGGAGQQGESAAQPVVGLQAAEHEAPAVDKHGQRQRPPFGTVQPGSERFGTWDPEIPHVFHRRPGRAVARRPELSDPLRRGLGTPAGTDVIHPRSQLGVSGGFHPDKVPARAVSWFPGTAVCR